MTGVPQLAVPDRVMSVVERPVTDSLNVRSKTTVREVPEVAEVDQDADGSDESIVTDDAEVVVPGPLLPAPSETADERMESPTVPVLVHDKSIRYDDAELATGAMVHGDAVPVAVKSAAVRPVTSSLKAKLYESAVLPVGDAGAVRVAVGDVMSIVTAFEEIADDGPVLPLASVIVEVPIVTVTVPSEKQST
jgi:hypothetical protein